jgi:hypothetical protein
MINFDKKFIFIHVPKAGGTSVEKMLFKKEHNLQHWFGFDEKRQIFLQHLTCRQIVDLKMLSEEQFDGYFKFAIVRNPWDRCLSEYIWRIKNSGNFVDAKVNIEKFGRRNAKEIKHISFVDFLKKNFPWEEISFDCHMKPQVEYLLDDSGKPMVDFVGRLETLEKDSALIFNKIGIKHPATPHKNKTKHKPYWEYYDSETYELVAEIYKKDIEYFNYKFKPTL